MEPQNNNNNRNDINLDIKLVKSDIANDTENSCDYTQLINQLKTHITTQTQDTSVQEAQSTHEKY